MALKSGFARVALLLVVGSLVLAPACTTLAGTPGGTRNRHERSATFAGEIRRVDARRDVIQLREPYGRTRNVRYDRRTRVVDGRRRYSISALRRGDRIRIRVVYDRRGMAWADRVDVQWGGRDRRGREGRGPGWRDDDRRDDGRRGDERRVVDRREQRWAGTIQRVEIRRGYFTLVRGRSSAVVVRIPGRLRGEDSRRLARLRRGARISVAVRLLDGGGAELIGFL